MIQSGVRKLDEVIEQAWVVEFLMRFKALASKDRIVVFQRKDHIETLGALGILPHQAEETILGLTLEDYYKGAGESERDGEEVCEFGARVAGEEIYIKLIIDTARSKAICCSFHVAERQISYPFAQDGT